MVINIRLKDGMDATRISHDIMQTVISLLGTRPKINIMKTPSAKEVNYKTISERVNE